MDARTQCDWRQRVQETEADERVTRGVTRERPYRDRDMGEADGAYTLHSVTRAFTWASEKARPKMIPDTIWPSWIKHCVAEATESNRAVLVAASPVQLIEIGGSVS